MSEKQEAPTPTEAQKKAAQAFREETQKFLREFEFTSYRLAKAAGISQSTVSQFLSGQYLGNQENIEVRIRAVIDRETKRKKLKAFIRTYIDTSVGRRVHEAAWLCHSNRCMGFCVGDAGLGKSEAVDEYLRRHADVVLIKADPGYTAPVLVQELSKKVGGDGYTNLHDSFERVCSRLTDSGRLVLIDEAEQLPVRALEMVRRMWDHSNKTIGVLLIGMPRLATNLRGISGQYAQLYDRMVFKIKLKSLTDEDVRVITKKSIGDDSMAELLANKSQGNTRRLCNILMIANQLANIHNATIDADVIDSALNYQGSAF
jgi:DNA transposition AAA+ family ATPase